MPISKDEPIDAGSALFLTIEQVAERLSLSLDSVLDHIWDRCDLRPAFSLRRGFGKPSPTILACCKFSHNGWPYHSGKFEAPPRGWVYLDLSQARNLPPNAPGAHSEEYVGWLDTTTHRELYSICGPVKFQLFNGEHVKPTFSTTGAGKNPIGSEQTITEFWICREADLAFPLEELGRFEAGTPIGTVTHQPLQRGKALQNTIIESLKQMGYDPQSLPRKDPGKEGPRAEARKHLEARAVPLTESTFKKAWQELRKFGEIQDA